MRTRKQVLWWLFSGMKGGYNRALIVLSLMKEPQNAHQLSQSIGIDYKTVRHHLMVLEKNNMVECIGSGYGNCYFFKDIDEDERGTLSYILNKMGLEGLR
ncbi:MAG: winged helix-turn-helix transcriptional regulator [Candidatus Methanofastidiosa archaeon]|nr:winged helix-turn-helix transcriptional regulator [Candidatus Methanofastidiosa archaeon]